MKKYRVYFEQVNQVCYDVRAKNKDNAIKTALKEWKAENIPDWSTYVVDEDGNRC